MPTVDDYLKKVDQDARKKLEHIRAVIIDQVPDASELITYGMPGFKYKGKYLIAYAAFKDHLSVFPGAGAIGACKSELINHKVSKGTVQFTVSDPLPDSLLQKLVTSRLNDIDANSILG